MRRGGMRRSGRRRSGRRRRNEDEKIRRIRREEGRDTGECEGTYG
jgi:hypothetical protein